MATLVGLWHLNGNSTDFSGNNYHLTNNGTTTFSQGKLGSAADFGTGNSTKFLSIADASCPNLEIAGSQTWAAWVKFNALTAGGNYFIGKSNSTPSGWIGLQQNTNNKIAFDCKGLTTNDTVAGLTTVTTGIWYYVVGVYDGSALKIYLNGSLDNSVAASGSHTDSNGDFCIGRLGAWNNAASYMQGLIDEVQVYNVAKSADWVRKQYALGVGKYL